MKTAVIALCVLMQVLSVLAIDVSNRTYAAIAYSPSTGNYGYAYDYKSRKGAEAAALEKCNELDAQIVCWINRGFCSLALGDDKSAWGVGWEYGNGAQSKKSENRALENCRKRTTGGYIAVNLSSDGQYLWDRKDHTITIDHDGNVRDGAGNLITPTPGASP
ncbi:MAG TPA: DUF4189 domain-containing protein [Chthoniobacterales bacterium]